MVIHRNNSVAGGSVGVASFTYVKEVPKNEKSGASGHHCADAAGLMQRCICHYLRRHGIFTGVNLACTIACISKFISLRKKRAKTAANIGDATSGPHMVTSMILMHVQRIIDVVAAVR